METNDEHYYTHPELEDAAMLLSEGKFAEAAEKAMLFSDTEEGRTANEAKNILGLANFNMGKYADAAGYFIPVAESRNDVLSWFNVMTSATMSGDIQKGEEAYQKVMELEARYGNELPPGVPMIRYYYANALNDSGQYEKALAQLDELKNIYMRLKITDDTFLFMRGVPYFSMVLELAGKVFNGMQKSPEINAWLQELEQEVDEYGREAIGKHRHTGENL